MADASTNPNLELVMEIQQSMFFDCISLQASIGVTPEERLKKQRIFMSLTLSIKGDPPRLDAIHDVVDYDHILSEVTRIVEMRHYNLQETLCKTVATFCLSICAVKKVEISLSKPDIYQHVKAVGVHQVWKKTASETP